MSIWSISYKDKEGVHYVSFLPPPPYPLMLHQALSRGFDDPRRHYFKDAFICKPIIIGRSAVKVQLQ